MVSVAQPRTMSVMSVAIVSVFPIETVAGTTNAESPGPDVKHVVSPETGTHGDFAPMSVLTRSKAITTESDGIPWGAATGTRYSVARTTCAESRIPRGMENRRMDRADGSPPTTRFELSVGEAAFPTNELNVVFEIAMSRCDGVPAESNVANQVSVGPRPPLSVSMVTLASESAVTRMPNAERP